MSMESSSAGIAIDRPARAATSPSFFLVAHLALLAAVLFGFSPTFYLHSVFKVGSFPTVLYVHGAVLTGWFVLTVSQASLMRLGRPQLHRQLGYVTAGYALLVVVMGLVADTRIALQTDSAVSVDNLIFWGNLFTLLLFAVFVSLAVVFRGNPDAHKRLTLLASFSIVGPALARFTEWRIFPGGDEARPVYGIAGLLLLFASLIVYDLIVRRRPHPVSWIGAVAVLVSLVIAGLLGLSGEGYRFLHAA
jgi:hypothetical protein